MGLVAEGFVVAGFVLAAERTSGSAVANGPRCDAARRSVRATPKPLQRLREGTEEVVIAGLVEERSIVVKECQDFKSERKGRVLCDGA